MAKYPARVRQQPAEWYRAVVGATAEAVGAEKPEHGVEKTLPEKSDEVRDPKSGGGESGGEWVTPKKKKAARKKTMKTG